MQSTAKDGVGFCFDKYSVLGIQWSVRKTLSLSQRVQDLMPMKAKKSAVCGWGGWPQLTQ